MTLYIILSITFFHLFLAVTFWSLMTRKIAKEYFIMLIIVGAFVSMLLGYIIILSTNYTESRPFTFIITLLIISIISIISNQYKDARGFFAAFLPVSFAMAVRSLQDIIFYLTNSQFIAVSGGFIMYILVGIFTIKWLSPKIKKLMNLVPEIWNAIAFLPVFFAILHYFLAVIPSTIEKNPSIIPGVFILLIFQIFAYYFLFKFCIRLLNEISAKQDAYVQNSIMTLNKAQENFILEVEKNIRIYRHDMRHYANLLKSYLQEGKTAEALDYILQLSSQMDTESEIRKYCSNLTLNAIISRYASISEKGNIPFNRHVRVGDTIPFDEISFGISLSNALENAFNACKMLKEEVPPYVNLKCIISDEQVFLSIENPFSGTISFNENNIPLSFEANHGFGTESIVAFAQKNDALLSFTAENHIFKIILAKTLN